MLQEVIDKIPSDLKILKSIKKISADTTNKEFMINSDLKVIEFKNGGIKTVDIYRKIYDSLIMLVEMEYITQKECRNNAQYIVVYNESEYGEKYLKCREEQSNLKIQKHVRSLAEQPRKLFDLNKLDGYLVNKTFTLTQKEFQEQFICIKEKEEMVYLE